MTEDSHEGGCLCGSTRYRVVGAPAWSGVCHCRFCQRISGSAFRTEAVFLRSRLAFTEAPPERYDHRGDHGRILRLHFCGRCATRVALTFERFPEHVGVCGGTFDDPGWFRPRRHVFTATAVPWFRYPTDVDCFHDHPVGVEGVPLAPWQQADRLRDGPGLLYAEAEADDPPT